MFPPNQPCHQSRAEILAIFDRRHSDDARSLHRHQGAFREVADQKLLHEDRAVLIARPSGREGSPE
jgi:hypothetical protein